MKRLAVLAFLGLSGSAFAIVVPNSLAGVEGDGVFSLTSTATAGRTFQLSISSGQLSGAVGQNIVGMRFRMNNGAATWPTISTSFATWNIFVGPGVAPSAMSNTFASNFTSAATQVRSGGLTFNANDFTGGVGPNPFGPAINFNTPYTYAGGHLTIEMRFSGQVGATNQPAFDAVTASGGPANGWGVDFAGRWTSNIAGVTGGNANFLVTDLITAPVPEPATFAALGLGAVALLRRRKSKKA